MSGELSPFFSLSGKRVWIAGHCGMVGSALVRRLSSERCTILTVGRNEVDLRRQAETEAWIERYRPEAVFLAAARVGGIYANNTRPADFIYDNLAIQTNVIQGALKAGVGKLLFLGSSCIYPRHAEQPIIEEALLTGPLEPTNEWYAIAKIAGIKLCQACRTQYGADFISAQPTNLYGPFDNFDLTSSHVIPALIAKAYAAKCSGAQTMEAWGTGSPRREFLHVDDLADALVFLIKHYSGPVPLNVGSGEELTIREVAEAVVASVGFAGDLVFDPSKPDGTPRKRLDCRRLTTLGWQPQIPFRQGLEKTCRWYLENHAAGVA